MCRIVLCPDCSENNNIQFSISHSVSDYEDDDTVFSRAPNDANVYRHILCRCAHSHIHSRSLCGVESASQLPSMYDANT